ncbi:radical SAM family heme chaperone HemW [Phycicoccus sp. Soil748]|uniref:radical SAM family heme chaperone HemW n=1 Tax=Phycicoccus sp. Soil748 TaxID=1736397 RepID=UPI0007031369|nr:radical SAM family heme chaperone HemW [Phycicoccus sp. Soil748]KRE53868.1 coproporphyrinogen III oxidase [Phycicoccus sp. Soil748]
MPSALPDGDPAPADGRLPESALATLTDRSFGIYLHVPFCSVRCGYCDFNTYTLTELGTDGASVDTFAGAAARELDLARSVLGGDVPQVQTVFVGGGTPTMLAAADLAAMLTGVRDRFGLAPGAEVSTEANPDSVTPEGLELLAEAGFTRVSLGMQSAVPHVLRTLERTHDPANVAKAVDAARAAGLQVSLDLIYGTPGESLDDWRTSLRTATDLGPDHVSAYALVVEDGTKLAAQVRRGQVPAPEDDDEAAKYELADEHLAAAGYGWYEVSNWAAREDARCRHNEGYWADGNWWGIGPGAHSHVGGVRWWNVKHPNAYASRVAAGTSPAHGRETLTDEQRYDERVLLGVRLVEGLPIEELRPEGRTAVAGLIADGLVDATAALRRQRVVLTRQGRLLADTVVRRLLGLR